MLKILRVRRSAFFEPMTPGWIAGTSLFFTAVLAVYWMNRAQGFELTLCPMRTTLGLPCPLCGGTTASLKLAFGEPVEALKVNPLVTLALAAYSAWTLLWLGFGIRLTIALKTTAVAGLLLLILSINWGYILSTRS